MKHKVFLITFFIIIVLVVSFSLPYFKQDTKSFAVSKSSDNLNNFITNNSLNKDDLIKLDDNYYAIKDDKRIINLNKKEFINANDIVSNKHEFKELLFREFRKKYPLFIVETFLDNDYNEFNVFDDMIYVSFVNTEGNKYEVSLICKDYKDMVSYKCVEDIKEDPNVVVLDPYKKTVALTFDDGPCEFTNSVIEQLNNFNMKATFFELGSLMERYPEMVKKVRENGFEVASHGYSHTSFLQLNVEGTLEELNKTNEIYKRITGEDIKLVRPPYGAINPEIRDSIATTFVKWNVDSLDWKVKSIEYVENIMSTVKDGDIILVHDIQKTTAEYLTELLTRLYNEGFQVVTVSELAGIKGIGIEVNKVYFHF